MDSAVLYTCIVLRAQIILSDGSVNVIHVCYPMALSPSWKDSYHCLSVEKVYSAYLSESLSCVITKRK